METQYDIVIVGGGPAGLTAAIYARRAGRSVLLLEKEGFGGQIASSPRVENYPGLPGISGAALSDKLFSQAEALGARLELEEVQSIQDGSLKTVTTDYGSYRCKALILATGMKRRTLGLSGEETLQGVSWCAVCDGAFYRDSDVAVCGGGNAALQDALFLSGICHSVTVIHRRDTFRGYQMLLEELRRCPNVSFRMNTTVDALLGETALTGLSLRDAVTGKVSALPVSALFEAVGQLPQRTPAETLLPLDDAGFIPSGEGCRTPVSGVFSAGDCRVKEVRQLTTACADGAVAAVAAARYCQEH
jgi:thioredoxin reductase (NADPH)